MGLFDFYKVNVFTAMSGVVTFDGKPVKGIKAVLNVRVVFNNKNFTVSTETDDSGRFYFDAITTNSINTILPSAKMINQKVFFYYQGEEYLGWDMVKNNYEYNGELNDLSEPNSTSNIIPLILTCDLKDKSTTRKAGTHEHVALTGICRWSGEPIK